MDSIQIFDDFLEPTDLYDSIDIIDNVSWTYTRQSRPDTPLFWTCDLNDNKLFNERVLSILSKKVGMEFELLDLYASGLTFGLDGYYHEDCEDEGHYSFILYLSDINEMNIENIGGHLLFKDGKNVKCVEPYLNRGIFFDSRVLHRALAPHRSGYILRTALIYKLKVKR